MAHLIIIPSKDNTTTHVYSERSLLNYSYSVSIVQKSDLDYFECYLVSNNTIRSGDICIVTDPDGCYFPEVCAEVILVGNRRIFYGKEGTRCLLCDVQKITATTDKAFISHNISPLSGEELQRLLSHKKQMASKANFFLE